jgi:hypothetical protein
MSKFNTLYESIMSNLNEKGEEAGKLELVKTDLETARKFAKYAFEKEGSTLEDSIPNFDQNYKLAQRSAGLGKTKRKDMPVIKNTDVRQLQQRLSNGVIDVNAPFGDKTNVNDPFPEGLKGKEAEAFLKGGLKVHDGKDKDDKVKVTKGSEPVGKLKPIQQQIYFDKSIGMTAPFGVKGTKDFLQSPNNFYITSSDNYIIDGHHRFLQGVLIDPKMKVPVLKIDLPLSKLLPMTLAYGDAIGNDRNK